MSSTSSSATSGSSRSSGSSPSSVLCSVTVAALVTGLGAPSTSTAEKRNSSDSPTSMEFVGCWLAGSVAIAIVALPGLPAKPKVKPSGT